MLRGTKSREEICDCVNISVLALQMYENGERIPRDEVKIKLANFYNISIEFLFFTNELHNSCVNCGFR